MSGMWQSLARYQPFADRRGFGCEWSRMTAERTAEAARDAARAAGVADAPWPAEDAASVLAFALESQRGGSWKSYAKWLVQYQAGRAVREERAEVL